MGCCAVNAKMQMEIPFDNMEDYEKLKIEIEQFLSSKDPKEKDNTNKILDFLTRTKNQISEYETELNRLQNIQTKNESVNDELIEGITQDIKILKDYYTILDKLAKENQVNNKNNEEKGIINETEIIINNSDEDDEEEINTNNLKNNKEINNKENSIKENEDIYLKKSIRRNKKGIINQNNKNLNINGISNNLYLNYINIINIIFKLENGKKIEVNAKKNEKFLDVIERLDQNDIRIDLKNLEFYDGKNNINKKIIEGNKVTNFNLNENHIIYIKSKIKKK